MDLTSPQAFWLIRNGLGDVSLPLFGNRRCDVAVIGGGITGALCADALTEAGLSVIIVDKRHPGLGSTSASTALLQYELDESLIGETEDSLPFIGSHPELDDRILFALGYGANGIPFGALGAEIVTARTTGRKHRYDNTFIFGR